MSGETQERDEADRMRRTRRCDLDTVIERLLRAGSNDRVVVATLPPALATYWERPETDPITITGTRRDYILRGHVALNGREGDLIKALQEPAVIRQDKSHARRVTLYTRGCADDEELLIVVENKRSQATPTVITAFPVHRSEIERRRKLEPLIWEE